MKNLSIRSSAPHGMPPRSTLVLEGSLTIYEAAEAKPALLEACGQGERIELDLAGVGEIDTAGAQLLVLARREALHGGREIVVGAHSDATRAAFELLNLSPHFGKIDESVR